MQKIYDTTLSELMEKHAPKRKVKKRYQPSTPWFDSDCSSAKRKTRLYERCYKKSRSEADRLIWINQIRSMHKLYSEKQNSYWAHKVRDSHSNSGKLWKTLSSILCRDKKASSGQSKVTADDFSRAFAAKVENVRASTDSAPFPVFSDAPSLHKFDTFEALSCEDAIRLVKRANNKNCALDPLPTWIVKQYVVELSQFITSLLNASISSGQFPSSQKCAIVTPLLKKETLDPR